jgi:alanyl aminopeptidase
MPNADGAGYFRFDLDDAGWTALVQSTAALTDKEVLSLLDSMDASFMAGRMNFDQYLTRLRTVLTIRQQQGPGITWDMAEAVHGRLSWFDRVLLPEASRPQMARVVSEMYSPLYARLGLDRTSELDKTHPNQATLMRSPVVSAMAFQARSPQLRTELAKRAVAYLGKADDGAVHAEAIDPDLADEALQIAVQDRGAPFVKDVLAHLKTERNGSIRQRLLSALTRSTDPAIAAQVRALALSEDLRTNEIPTIIFGMMSEPTNRAAAWTWFKDNFEAVKQRTPPNNREALVGVGSYFCTASEAADYEKFMTPKANDMRGAPRSLAATLERIKACAALIEKQRPVAQKTLAALK